MAFQWSAYEDWNLQQDIYPKYPSLVHIDAS